MFGGAAVASASDTITINVPRDILYRVITDYEKYPEFLPETEEIEILNRGRKNKDGSRKVDVGYQIKVIKKFAYTLQMTETPEESIRWEQIDGPFKVNTGGWSLKSVQEDTTEATCEVTVEVGFLVPRTITNMLVGQSLPDTLKRFKERAESLTPFPKKKAPKKKKNK